ncbi:MAG: hypothetical protein AAGD96_17955, partial [Chloroflexota bacterium]
MAAARGLSRLSPTGVVHAGLCWSGSSVCHPVGGRPIQKPFSHIQTKAVSSICRTYASGQEHLSPS